MTPTRRGAGLVAAGALVAGALGALPMSAAHAAEVTTDYSCDYTGGPHASSLSADVQAPATILTGQPLTLSATGVEYAWGATWSQAGRDYSMKYKGVTATVPVIVNGVALAQPAKLTFDDADLVVPAAGNMTWPAKIAFPAIPTTSGADVSVTFGKVDFDMQVALSLVGGGNIFIPAKVPCAVSGAAPTVASVDVLPPGTLASAAALRAVGKPVVGQRLSAVGGTTTPASAVAYTWLVGGKAAGAGAAYVVKPADLGKAVALSSRATKVGYKTKITTVTVGKVAAGTFVVPGKPKVTGKAKVGKTLTAKPRAVAGTKVTYQWLKNGKAVKGAKAKKLKLKKSFKGKKVSVKVTYTRAGYRTVVVTSAAKKVKK